jgi:hypothetical protein
MPFGSRTRLAESTRPLRRRRLLYYVAAVLVVAAMIALAATPTATAQMWGAGCRVVGYQHPFDIVTVPVCNAFGCAAYPQQVPCQHPLWSCG